MNTQSRNAVAEMAYKLDNYLAKTKPNQNTIYSPASLYNVLASVYFGTGENSATRKELQTVFNFDSEFQANQYAKVLGSMTQNKILENFNSYVFHKDNLNEDYKNDLKSLKFNDKLFDTFTGKEPIINKIVKDDTDGMIEQMFNTGDFSDLTELVLLNTILFKGMWEEKFDEDTQTKRQWEFNSTKFDAEFMTTRKQRNISVYKDRNGLNLQIAFKKQNSKNSRKNSKKSAYFTIVMPNEEKSLNSIKFNNVDLKLFLIRNEKAKVVLPKFKIKNEINFVDFMKSVGAERLFNSETADLTRMFQDSEGKYVDQFFQKAAIEVDENGAKAAAATAAVMMVKSAGPRPRNYLVNRPFKYFIHDDRETLYFSGVVNCPMNNCY